MTGGVDGRARELVARADVDRDRLAREQRRVDRARPGHHDTVGRDLLAGSHRELVAHVQLGDRDALLGAAPVGPGDQQGDVLGAEVEERTERIAGPTTRPVLGVPAREQERRDDRGRLEVEFGDRHAHPGVPGGEEGRRHPQTDLARAAEQERPQRPGGRRDDADRHERVHRRGTVPARAHGCLVERPGRPGRDGQREHRDDPLPARELQGRDHRQGEDGHGEDGRAAQPPTQVGAALVGRGGRVLVGLHLVARGHRVARQGVLDRVHAHRVVHAGCGVVPLRCRAVPGVGFCVPGVGVGGLGGGRRERASGQDPCVVPGLADRGDEGVVVRGRAGVVREQLDVSRLEREVDRRRDARDPVQTLLDVHDARRARHPLDREVDGGDGLGALGADDALGHSSEPFGVSA